MEVTFRDRLLGTLRALQPILEEPGVLVVGSEVPNLLEPSAASTLVVSQDVDLGVPLDRLEAVKRCLRRVEGLVPSAEEPSVYVPTSPNLIEANFLGLDSRIREASETYVFEDAELPLNGGHGDCACPVSTARAVTSWRVVTAEEASRSSPCGCRRGSEAEHHA